VPLLIVAAAVVAAGAAGLSALSRRQRRRQLQLNAVVPGVLTSAPASWALSHDPEAKLHRRLRDAVAALRADPRVRAADLYELRLLTEREAIAIDERLVAVAALPEPSRQDALKRLTAAVESLEQAVAEIVSWSPSTGLELTAAVADATERLAMIAEIHAELSAFPPPRPLPEPPPLPPPAP
jgi:hypothetical protein